MSVNILSVGNFDYSPFDLTSNEETIISFFIKYDIYFYFITKDLKTNNIEFFMNTSSLEYDNAIKIFSDFFDLLEEDFLMHNKSEFSTYILHFAFNFIRSVDDSTGFVSWQIKTENLDKIKIELFKYFHKNIFYNHLLRKLPLKHSSVKLGKI